MKEKSMRLKYIDAVKGIAMLAIVLGHMQITLIDRFVFTFHVPIFFVLSGMFFAPKDGLIKKRFFGLIKPYLTTAFAIFILNQMKLILKLIIGKSSCSDLIKSCKNGILTIIYGSGSNGDFLSLKINFVGAIWFLLALIWATIFLWIILKKIKNNGLQFLIILLLFLIAYFTAKYIWFPFSIQSGMSAVLFMYVGYLLKNFDLSNLTKSMQFIITIVLIFIWGIAIYFSYTNINMSLVRSFFPNVVINVLGACSASYVIIELLKKVEIKFNISAYRCYDLLCYIGKNSLVFLCLHTIEFFIIPWHLAYKLPIPEAMILFIIYISKLVWSLTAIYIINKIAFLKKLFV